MLWNDDINNEWEEDFQDGLESCGSNWIQWTGGRIAGSPLMLGQKTVLTSQGEQSRNPLTTTMASALWMRASASVSSDNRGCFEAHGMSTS